MKICLICLISLSAFAAPAPSTVSVTLEWARSDSPEVNAYRIYYGVSGTVPGWNGTNTVCACYTNSVTLGNVTNVTLNNLVRDQNYYFAATAVSTNGLESDYSNEVLFKAPKKPNPPKNLTGQ